METHRNQEPNLRIWIVEDDDEFREILGDSLAQESREIRLFKDGQEALSAIPDGFFEILITDLVMPGADGIQILNEVKRSHPDRIVVIMTGYASIDSTIKAIRGGAHDYIRKPFKLEEMEIVIRKASEKIALVRENKALLNMLKEMMEQMNQMKKVWEEHLSDIGPDEKISEMELILSQINPVHPDQNIPRKDVSERAFAVLEKLIHFKREGLIDEGEFQTFKRMLLDRA